VENIINSNQSSGISTGGMFLNTGAEFDVKNSQGYCYQQEIVDNIV
jgi:ABC-type amino acid transport system permease subunit